MSKFKYFLAPVVLGACAGTIYVIDKILSLLGVEQYDKP